MTSTRGVTDDLPDLPADRQDQLQRIQRITDSALSRLGVEDLLHELLVRARALLYSDMATVMLVDSTQTELVATATSGLEQEVYQGIRIPLGQGFAGRVAATAQPLAIEDVDPTNVLSPAIHTAHITSLLGVPMISSGQVVGVLYVGAHARRRFTPADVELLQLVADRLTHAAQARTHSLDRAAAYALQRSLLPSRPPVIEGLDLAVRYVPGADDVGVGGDWYDVFELPDGHIAAAVGDVAGNGLRAAVVMGRIRSALRAYALETSDPADVLTRLDRKIQRFEPDAMATVVYGVINPALETIVMSSAGHLPPIVVTPEAPSYLADVAPDLPLGAYPQARRHNTELTIAPGSGLLLYTDGLVERRGRPLSKGLGLLTAAAAAVPAEFLCASVMAALLDDRAPTDDIAILTLRRTGTPH